MLMPRLMLAVLGASDVQAELEPPPEPPKWALHLSLGSPSIVGAAFDLTPRTAGGLGVLGAVSRAGFTNALTVERSLGEHWSALGAISLGYSSIAASSSMLSGAAVFGARWYASRTFDGFWAGPELLAQLNTAGGTGALGGLIATRAYAAGARGRVGWTQRFGEHILVSGSAGVTMHVSWQTSPAEQVTLNVGLDVALAAGFAF